MKEIMIIFGTRRKSIKLAPEILCLKKYASHMKAIVCVTAQHREMRKTTERRGGIKAGIAKLVGTDSKGIFEETVKLIKDKRLYNSMAKTVNPNGDSRASFRIINIIRKKLKS